MWMWLGGDVVVVASQSTRFFLCSREQIRMVETAASTWKALEETVDDIAKGHSTNTKSFYNIR
jgi:hypothetical protein